MPEILTQISLYVIWFFLYSFAGWLYEVIYSFVRHHRFVNRGFFFGPLCPIYGVGALMAILLIGPIPNLVVAFLAGAVGAGVVEFVTSWVLERVFHARWWDYTGWVLNIQGRVCLASVVTFGVMMLLVSRVIHPYVARFGEAMPPLAAETLAAVLVIVFVTDLVLSVLNIRGIMRRVTLLQEHMTALAASASSKVGEVVADITAAASEFADEVASRANEVAGEALNRIEDASEAARSQVGRLQRNARQAWASLHPPASMAELAESLHDLIPQFGRAARREARDPFFMPTNAREAWELVRGMLHQQAGARARQAGRDASDGDAVNPEDGRQAQSARVHEEDAD